MDEMMTNLTEEEINNEFYTHKNKKHADRRHNNVTKALRKRSIIRKILGRDYYDNLHRYSKNKIHCSCNLCRFRPSWNPDAKTMQDRRLIDAMDYKIKEYKTGEAV